MKICYLIVFTVLSGCAVENQESRALIELSRSQIGTFSEVQQSATDFFRCSSQKYSAGYGGQHDC